MGGRHELRDMLRTLRPEWKIEASERTIDATDRPVLQLSQRTVERIPAAGTGQHAVGIVATLSTPGTDLDHAEDDLDQLLDELLFDLDAARLLWSDCSKGKTTDERLCYQLTITITSERTR